MKDFFNFKEVFTYLFKPHRSKNFNTAAMHWINRLAIVMFLGGVLYIIFAFYV